MTLVLKCEFSKSKMKRKGEGKRRKKEERNCSPPYLVTAKNKQKVRQKRAVAGNDINSIPRPTFVPRLHPSTCSSSAATCCHLHGTGAAAETLPPSPHGRSVHCRLTPDLHEPFPISSNLQMCKAATQNRLTNMLLAHI